MPALNVYGHPQGESWPDIRWAVATANGLQTQFKCSLKELSTPLSGTSRAGSVDQFEQELLLVSPPIHGLIFYEETVDNNVLVSELLPRRIYVSCQVERGLDAPPFRLYVLYQIAAAALTLEARLSNATNEAMIHQPPVGCLWDWWRGRDQRATAMMIAWICSTCQTALRKHGGLGPEWILAAQQILEYVRRSMMGDLPTVANRVFIAYGQGRDWEDLRDLLVGWKLEVEHFNCQAVAGILVADRWRQMLDRSRFAFAVMTPDDAMADGTRRARQNVVHEIGLCHARLGIQSTAILLASGTESFTNVSGINHISFTSGELKAVAPSIRDLLTARGIL